MFFFTWLWYAGETTFGYRLAKWYGNAENRFLNRVGSILNSIAMKKLVFFLCILGIATVFFYCSKRSGESGNIKNQKDIVVSENVNPLKLDDVGSTCNCAPGSSSCKSECIFSDCCICWDPKKETGACGCYYGIAKCKTAAIGTAASDADTHTIQFHPQKFHEFMKFLKNFSIDLSPVQEAYEDLLGIGTTAFQSIDSNAVLVPQTYYDRFYETYSKYISRLSESNKRSVLNYIQSKSGKWGRFWFNSYLKPSRWDY